MAVKIIAFICVQITLFEVIKAQCLNRFPGIFPGCNNVLPVPENIIPNQVILPNYPNQFIEVPYGVEPIVSNPIAIPATTIIQDSTVANNLANALQLLVVSNLLSNTLPTGGDIIVPSYGPALDYGVISPIGPCSYSPYNYIY